MNMEKNRMKDTVKAASFGFIELGFRNGHIEVVATSDIKSVRTRTEGSTSIRLAGDRVLLTSVSVGDVMNALRMADEGESYATA
jgi:hypothetical protein